MCRIDYDDTECVILSERKMKARLAHRCTECGRTIERGEEYDRVKSAQDRVIRVYKTCQHCQIAARWLFNNCNGYIFQQVGDEILEHAEEYRRPDLARLVVGINHKWKRLRSDGLMPVPALPGGLS